ncbi:hypothetical protein [Geodermatophilus sp. SYSU D01119]
MTVQEIPGDDPEPMYVIQVKVPMRAGEFVHDELLIAVGEAVLKFQKAIPDRAWEARVTGRGLRTAAEGGAP